MLKRYQTPGEALRDKLAVHGIDLYDLSELVEVAVDRLREMMDGRRRITPGMAHVFADLFVETTPEEWIQLQRRSEEIAPVKRRVIVVAAANTRIRERKDPELRRTALRFVDDGLSSEAAGDACGGVKKMTVAGWRAARTKGLYDGED